MLAVGAGAFVYRTLLPNIFIRRFVYSIKSAQPKGIGTIEVTLSPVGRNMRFRAGQFIFISFLADGVSPEWHPFSVSSPPTRDDVTIDIKSLGTYTETLTRILPQMVGMTARIEGAYGRFSYQNVRNPNQVWIAGGIGITPFLSMAQAFGAEPYNINLYYSVRTQSELIDLEVLAAAQKRGDNQIFRVFPFMADTYNAHLSANIIASNTGDLAHHDYLLCGSPAMMKAITTQLRRRGVPARRIHNEEFSLS